MAAALLLRVPTHPAAETAARTVTFVDLSGGQAAALQARIRGEFDAAADAVSDFWGSDWPAEVVVVTTATDAQFASQAGGPAAQWTGIAAVAVADRWNLDRKTAAGQKIVFAAGATAMSDRSLRIVLRHEMFHYAARAVTAPRAPQWLTEGVADYVARPAAPAPRWAADTATLPSDADFAGPDRSLAYDRAWWFARFVADRYGPESLRQLYRFGCGATHPSTDVAVAAVLGTTLPALLDQWRQWLAA